MKRAIFAAFIVALVSCTGNTESAKIEAYLDALHPQFAPHKVTGIVRRDSAVNPLPEVERALTFYAEQKTDFEERLAKMNKARSEGDDLTFQVARLAALEAVAEANPTAPLDWVKDAIDSAFVRGPKDCIALECKYTREGASEDQSVFFFSPDGKKVAYSSLEHIDRTLEVFDALDDVKRVFNNVLR